MESLPPNVTQGSEKVDATSFYAPVQISLVWAVMDEDVLNIPLNCH